MEHPEYKEYPLLNRVYKHYKGGTYEVITLAKHSETQEDMVVYKSLLYGSVHVRPLSMWYDLIDLDPEKKSKYLHQVERFTLVN